MSTASQYHPVSVTDYLAGERQAKRKHEFVDGVVYTMAGATVQHNRIASNATVALGSQLRDKRCEVFNSDMKIRVRLSRGTRFYYPDVHVVCQTGTPSDVFHDAPVVIVEVISESTRRTDEFEKREAYLTIDSLSVYILVETSAPSALVYRRADSGFEREVYAGLDAIIPLPEIESELAISEIYRNVEFVPLVTDDEPDS